MNDYVKDLCTYVEVISDDFRSTFSVVDVNTLTNMMGPEDFNNLTSIVSNYIPGAKLEFIKTNQLKGDYDIYLMRLIDRDREQK